MALYVSGFSTQLRRRDPSFTDELHPSEKRWFAVRTSSRHEKRAASELKRDGVEAYVPVREKVCHYATKTVTRELPLLTGYVFVRITTAEELTVVRAHYTAGFVRLGRERRRVRDEEIEALRKISTDRELNWEAVEESFDFSQGTPVEIIHGPLAGVRGHYLSKKSKKIFVISLGDVGACLSTCEVDPRYLVTINGESMAPNTPPDVEGSKVHW